MTKAAGKLVWQTVYDGLRQQIDDGTLAVGAPCPSENELVLEYQKKLGSMSRGTVRSALRRLVQDGYLEPSPGQQRLVRKPDPLPLPRFEVHNWHRQQSWGENVSKIAAAQKWPKADYPYDLVLQRPNRTPWFDIRDERRLDVNHIRKTFQFKHNEEIWWCLRARYAKQRPLALQWIVVPTRLIPEFPADALRTGGVTDLYARLGIQRYSARTTYAPTSASSDEARSLRVEGGAPLILETRVSYYQSPKKEQPYEYLVTLYTDRALLSFEWLDASANQATSGGTPKSPKGQSRSARQSTVKQK